MSTDPTPTDFTPPELEEIAALLPAYEILSFIAKGGMGAVYMARQKSLDRDVAIKILPRHFGEDASFRASFETEAKSMAKLNHPNLISIYDFGQIDGMLYIIMEMVQGKSLFHSAYGKTIDPKEAGRIVSEICHGLAHAHKHGILHRDIKPANILLDPHASPKIGDFGLARPVGDFESDTAFGTPGYTAPEVVHHPAAVDESTDIYAVGAILYELLTSKLPENNYTPAASLVGCAPKFDQIIRKAMHPTPALRYRSADAMAKEIEQVISGKSDNAGRLIQASSKPSSGTARTLLTAAPGSKKPTPLNTKGNLATGAVSPSSHAPISTGSSIPFVRNIIIIIALLAAIYVAWEGLKFAKAHRAAEQAKINELKEQQKQKEESEKLRKARELAKARKNQQPKPKPNPPTPKPPQAETPMESLVRLRKSLLDGNRDALPIGTLERDGRARFFVQEPMSWHEARAYCESFGGHLAVLPETNDLRWLCSKLKSSDTIWIGAGSAGNGQWSWVDGSPWKQDIRNTSKAAFVAVDDTGILSPQPGKTEHSFFIEWNMDGSTPATLKEQLKRCAQSISNGSPRYPAGTVSYDNRHYLLIGLELEWRSARELANLAGATLAVPSNPDENIWMLEMLSSMLEKDEACWIGGIRKANMAWGWSTGEPWNFATWGQGLPDEDLSQTSMCAVLPTQAWDDYPADSSLSHFLIEWSKDGQGHATVKDTGTNKIRSLDSIHKKCTALVKDIRDRYEKQLTSNIKGYEQELNIFIRSLPNSQKQAYSEGVMLMKSNYVNNRIPDDLARENMPAKLQSILDTRLRRQTEAQTKYMFEIETLREKYRRTLFSMANDLKGKGLNSQLRLVEDEIEATTAGEAGFVEYMLGDQEPE